MLGSAHGAEDLDFFFIPDEFLSQLVGAEKGDISAGTRRAFSPHPVFSLGHFFPSWFGLSQPWIRA
jgi:hypothetical protein